MGDATYIAVSLGIFLLVLGIFIPFVDTTFYTTSIDTDNFEQTILTEDVTAVTMLTSIFKMFTWTFGALPAWLDGLLVIVRISFAFAVAKVIRG